MDITGATLCRFTSPGVTRPLILPQALRRLKGNTGSQFLNSSYTLTRVLVLCLDSLTCTPQVVQSLSEYQGAVYTTRSQYQSVEQGWGPSLYAGGPPHNQTTPQKVVLTTNRGQHWLRLAQKHESYVNLHTYRPKEHIGTVCTDISSIILTKQPKTSFWVQLSRNTVVWIVAGNPHRDLPTGSGGDKVKVALENVTFHPPWTKFVLKFYIISA